MARWPGGDGWHDPYLSMESLGTPKSVPVLLRTARLESWLGIRGNACCSVYDALEAITNQPLGDDLDQWRNWYRQNRSRSWVHWIEAGVQAGGHDYHFAPTADSARRYLALIGRDPWFHVQGDPDLDDPFRSRLAIKVLGTAYPPELIAGVCRVAAADGDLDSRWSILTLWKIVPDLLPNDVRDRLIADPDRALRLEAQQLDAESTWLLAVAGKARDDCLLKYPVPGVTEYSDLALEDFAGGQHGVMTNALLMNFGPGKPIFAIDPATRQRLWTSDVLANHPSAENSYLLAEGALYAIRHGREVVRLDLASGKVAWRTKLPSTQRFATPGQTPYLPVWSSPDTHFLRREDGSLAAQVEANVVAIEGELAVLEHENRIRSWRVGADDFGPEFRVEGENLGVFLKGGVALFFLAMDPAPNWWPRARSIRVEGWDVERGEKLYSRAGLNLPEDVSGRVKAYASESGLLIVQGNDSTLAMDPSSGAVVWESGVCGNTINLGEFVLVGRGALVVLETRTGRMVQRFNCRDRQGTYTSALWKDDKLFVLSCTGEVSVFPFQRPSVASAE
jgi:hypothetical protein